MTFLRHNYHPIILNRNGLFLFFNTKKLKMFNPNRFLTTSNFYPPSDDSDEEDAIYK